VSAPPPDERASVAELQALALFGALDDEVLAMLAERLPLMHVACGDVVFREGECGRAMFVVLEGELEVVKRSERGHDARIALLARQDWFGEMCLLDVMDRPATVRALTPSRLLQMRPTDLDTLYRKNLKAYALLLMNIARQLSRRLRRADAILADTVTSVLDRFGTVPKR
jgi:CRP-like cAMP-binding protein